MEEISLKVVNLSKIYKLYRKPVDRIKESFAITKKEYHKKFYALKKINLTIKKGELVGIIGRNGAGKSTLLKIITGVMSQSAGDVSVHGKISAILELGTGFNMEYTGEENIYVVGMLSGYSKTEMKSKIKDIEEFADIGEFIAQPVKNYSSGMFARLAFAVSINVNPDILIVDEALAVGDMKFQLKCMDKFNEFRDKGKTIIFVTHDIHSVKRFCSRAIWLDAGEIKQEGDVDRVADAYLDYLKIIQSEEIHELQKDIKGEYKQENDIQFELDHPKRNALNYEITNFQIFNKNHVPVQTIQHNQKIFIEIDYTANGNEINDIVIGVAILRIDNLYICGLNTLLDDVRIKTTRGKSHITLEYQDINLVSGKYYFDCGIFEKNAYVALDYKTKIKEFNVTSNYVGEGIVIFNHDWKKE